MEQTRSALQRAVQDRDGAGAGGGDHHRAGAGRGRLLLGRCRFLQALRELCDEHGIVLVVDEIQSGFARTGRMFAIEHSGVEPDIMTMAKSLAGGFPLAAVTGKAEIMDAPGPGRPGRYLRRHRRSAAPRPAVLDIIEDEQLCARATAIGERMTDALRRMRAKPRHADTIGDMRGLGAMVAMELVEQGDAGRPAPDLTRALVQRCAEDGLIILPCGVYGNVIRFLVPLTAERRTDRRRHGDAGRTHCRALLRDA